MDNRDNRNPLFASSTEESKASKLRHNLNMRQHFIKISIAEWLKEDAAARIPILEQASKDSFSSESQNFALLPKTLKSIFEDPKKYLGIIEVDDPKQTMLELVEEASSTAISEYMNTHPEYEENILAQNAIKQTLSDVFTRDESSIERMVSHLPDDQIQKAIQVLYKISQSRQQAQDVSIQSDLHSSPKSPRVK